MSIWPRTRRLRHHAVAASCTVSSTHEQATSRRARMLVCVCVVYTATIGGVFGFEEDTATRDTAFTMLETDPTVIAVLFQLVHHRPPVYLNA